MSKFAPTATAPAAGAGAAAAAAGAGAGSKPQTPAERLKAMNKKGVAFLTCWTQLDPLAVPGLQQVEKTLGLTTPADLAFRKVAYDHARPLFAAEELLRALMKAEDQYVKSLLPKLKLVVKTAAKCPGQTLSFDGLGSLTPKQMHELSIALAESARTMLLCDVVEWLVMHKKDVLLAGRVRVADALGEICRHVERTAPVCPMLKKKVVFFDQDDDKLPDFDFDMPLYVISEAVPLPPADEHYAKAAEDFCDNRMENPFLPIYASLDELYKELSSDLIGMNDANGADELAGLWWYTPNLDASTISVKRDGNGKFSVAEVARLLKLHSLPAAVQCNNGSMMIGFYARSPLCVLADVASAASPMQLSE